MIVYVICVEYSQISIPPDREILSFIPYLGTMLWYVVMQVETCIHILSIHARRRRCAFCE